MNPIPRLFRRTRRYSDIDISVNEHIEERTGMRGIRVLVPLAELFGYATDLRSRTQGRASHTPMQLHAYKESPAQIAREVIARVRGE